MVINLIVLNKLSLRIEEFTRLARCTLFYQCGLWFLSPIYQIYFWPPINKAAIMHHSSSPFLSLCLPVCMPGCLSVGRYTNKVLRTTKLIFGI